MVFVYVHLIIMGDFSQFLRSKIPKYEQRNHILELKIDWVISVRKWKIRLWSRNEYLISRWFLDGVMRVPCVSSNWLKFYFVEVTLKAIGTTDLNDLKENENLQYHKYSWRLHPIEQKNKSKKCSCKSWLSLKLYENKSEILICAIFIVFYWLEWHRLKLVQESIETESPVLA